MAIDVGIYIHIYIYNILRYEHEVLESDPVKGLTGGSRLGIGQHHFPCDCRTLVLFVQTHWTKLIPTLQSFHNVHPIWKLNAFTCFVAFSLGERFLEVGACCVQLVFWKTYFGTLIFLPAFLYARNFPNVSVPLGIGLCWVFPFWNLEMWLC